jgi:hypothetical protein
VRRALAVALLAFVVLGAAPRPAAAQAAVPAAGHGSVTFAVQMIDHYGRFVDDGTRIDCCGTTNVAINVEVEYALKRRWSFSASLPYVFASYRGPINPNAKIPQSAVDTCHCVHSSFQDFGFSTRYNLVNIHRQFLFTPSVSFGLPSHHYDYSGEAVIGTDLKDIGLGADIAQRFNAVPGLLLEGRYTYTIVSSVLDISHNRSNAAFQGTQAITRHLAGYGILSWQETHGGLRFPYDVIPYPERYTDFHRLLQDNYLHLGIGVSAYWQDWDVSASFLTAVRGTNTHEVYVYTLTASRSFRARR